jgi:hypothetical protein
MESTIATHELHWLAGLLEGEGSFMPGPPSNSRMPIIAVAMNDADVMSRLGRIFGRKVQLVPAAQPAVAAELLPPSPGREGGRMDDLVAAAHG